MSLIARAPWRSCLACAFGLTIGVLPLRPAPAAAAQAGEASRHTGVAAASGRPWGPWLGCWRREGQVAASSPALLVCVEQQGEQLMLRTLPGTTTVLEETIPIDGALHPVDMPGCEGSQRATWERTGRLLLTRTEVRCGAEPRQIVSRAALMRSRVLWLDVVVVDTGGRETVYLRNYLRVGDVPTDAEQALAEGEVATLTLEGLKDAVSIVSPRALEALLVETRPVFRLNGKTLLELKAAQVPPSLIDLVVALSFPSRFRVSGATGAGAGAFRGFSIMTFPAVPDAAGGGAPFWLFDDAYWDWGGCEFWDCLGTGIPVYPEEPSGPAETPASGHGRVVEGLGYAHVWPRESAVPRGGADQGDNSGSDSTADTDRSGSNDSSGGTGSVSPEGYSSGDSSDTGRTAEPRPPDPRPDSR